MSKQYNQKLSVKVIYILATAAFTGQQEMDHLFFFKTVTTSKLRAFHLLCETKTFSELSTDTIEA